MSRSLVSITGAKCDSRQQAIGHCQVIVIGCRRRVVAKLNGPSPCLLYVADLQTIFSKAMIKWREDCEIQRYAVFVHAASDIVELFARPLRLAESHVGFRQDCSLKEISKLIFAEDFIVDSFAERAGSVKVHCLDVQPCKCQTT